MVKDARPPLPPTPKPGEPAPPPNRQGMLPRLLSVGTAVAVGIAIGAGMLASAARGGLEAGPPPAEAARRPAEDGTSLSDAVVAQSDGPGPHPRLQGVLDACDLSVGARAVVSASVGGQKSRLLLVRSGVDWLLVDLLWGTHPRYAWRDGSLTVDTRAMPAPEPPPDVADVVVRDLWEGCRTRFPGTRWTVRRPDEDGYPLRLTALGWSKGELPYEWAAGVDLYVGVNVRSGRLEDIVWRSGRPPTWGHARVAEIDWASTDVPVFDRTAPEVDIATPKGFGHVK